MNIKVANEDIPCYKYGVPKGDGFLSGVSSSWLACNVPVDPRLYEVDIVQPKIELKIVEVGGDEYNKPYKKRQGYHSYTSMKDYSTSHIIIESNRRVRSIAMFIIPVGSKYYEIDESYISETIVFKVRYTRKEYLEICGLRKKHPWEWRKNIPNKPL